MPGGASEKTDAPTLRSAHSAPDSWGELYVGEQLGDGRFIVERSLGRGGMGLVYAVTDRARGASVALKTLQLGDPIAIQNIKREFRALVDLAHPNLVRLHELFIEGDRCFFSMDLIDGVDFLRYVRKGQPRMRSDRPRALSATVRSADSAQPALPARAPCAPLAPSFDLDALQSAFRQLVTGVHALHRAGKLHRDLKPSNVLVTADDQLAILDFGLVLDEFGSREAVQRGEIGGTPLYMAPELFARQPASPASDWFSVGVMLYEALTGEEPFLGVVPGLTRGTAGVEPIWPSEIVREIPGDLEVLCMRLLRWKSEERPDAETILATAGAKENARASSHAPSRAPVGLIGRDAQSAELRAAFEHCVRTRRPVVAFLAGVSGVGKTSLLEHAARGLRERALVLLGRCYERESVPHKAFDEVVDGLARELESRTSDEIQPLLPEHTAALAQLFPVLHQIPAIAERFQRSPEMLEVRELRRRGYRALGTLLGNVAGDRPLVIGIDDLHWGDLDSARLLAEMLGYDEAPPCLVIGTYREDEAQGSACLSRLLSGEPPLSASVEVRQIAVGELEPADARALAASLLDPLTPDAAQLLDAVCQEARGNPLLLRELASHEIAAGKVGQFGLGDVVRARLARLSEGERQLFELLCVAGKPLSEAVAAAVDGAPPDTSAAVKNLRAERLLRERTSWRPDAIDVFHDRIRVAAMFELGGEALQDRHRALAQAYQRAAPSDFEALARHHAGAGALGPAAEFAERAGDEACSALAFNRAADLYRMVLDFRQAPLEKARLLKLKLAGALSDAGRGREAAPLFMEAAAHAPARAALELRRRAAEQWLVSGQIEPGLSALGAVLSAVKLKLPRTPRAALFDLLLTRTRLRLRGLGFRSREAADVSPEQLLRIDACKASWALGFVNTIQGAAFQARFLEQALKAGEPSRVALGLGMEAIYVSAEGGRRESTVSKLRRSAKLLADRLDDPHVLAFEDMVEGQSSYLFGRWERTSQALERAEKLLVERCRAVTWELNSSRFFWGNSLIYQGRWRELARRTDIWLTDASDRGDQYASASLHLLRTRCLTLAEDAPERALEQIDAAMGQWRSPDYGVQRFLADCSRIQVALYQRNAARAVELVARLWPEFSRSLMSRIQLCRIHSYHHSAYALLAHAAELGERRPVLRQVARYAHKLSREEMPWASAFSEYVQAASAHLEGDATRAERGLRQAAEAFDACQMVFYAAACRARLGELLGGERGRALVEASATCLRAQGVLRPERIISMMAPGFERMPLRLAAP